MLLCWKRWTLFWGSYVGRKFFNVREIVWKVHIICLLKNYRRYIFIGFKLKKIRVTLRFRKKRRKKLKRRFRFRQRKRLKRSQREKKRVRRRFRIRDRKIGGNQVQMLQSKIIFGTVCAIYAPADQDVSSLPWYFSISDYDSVM